MEFSEQVIQLIDDLAMRFGIIIDWSQENIMPYLSTLMQKYIVYELFINIFNIFITGILFFLLLKLFMKSFKRTQISFESCDEDEEPYITCTITSAILTVLMGVVFLIHICIGVPEIIACLTFPEKIIFDELKNFMN